jgi:hypothetical protein
LNFHEMKLTDGLSRLILPGENQEPLLNRRKQS